MDATPRSSRLFPPRFANRTMIGLLFLWGAASSALPAQTQSLTGVVRDSAGRAIVDADVILEPSGRRTRTSDNGRFVFERLASGEVRLRVRYVGFHAFEERIYLGRGANIRRTVVLTRLPPLLATVRIVDQNACAPTSLEGFECRRLAGVGHYRDAGEIRSMSPQHWADMLDGMPGLRRSLVLGPLGREWRVAAQPSRCVVELWNGQPPMKVDPTTPFPPDLLWRPEDVVAIEYYDDHKKVPARYEMLAWTPPPGGQPCGLIIYWLRGAERTPARKDSTHALSGNHG